MKKLFVRISLLLVSVSLALAWAPPGAAAAEYRVVVDGTIVSESLAELQNGQMMVSVRPFVETMGGGVTWQASDRRVTVQYNGSLLAFWLGSDVVYINGQRHAAPIRPYVKESRTMVPAWWLAVRLGASVSYSGGTLTVETGDYHEGVSPRPAPQTGHPLMDPAYLFPFPLGAAYDPFPDTWGDSRKYQGNSFPHEGTDILARKGTPVVAVASGRVVRFGWNTLGGYRVTIQLDDHPEYRFYYAHLDHYASGIYQGARVRAGQLLGYVGNTGEGPERTEGKFVPHLHFGIYAPDGAINPYAFLKYWERHRSSF